MKYISTSRFYHLSLKRTFMICANSTSTIKDPLTAMQLTIVPVASLPMIHSLSMLYSIVIITFFNISTSFYSCLKSIEKFGCIYVPKVTKLPFHEPPHQYIQTQSSHHWQQKEQLGLSTCCPGNDSVSTLTNSVTVESFTL